MGFLSWANNKLAPAAFGVGGGAAKEEAGSTENTVAYQSCYERLEVVNRAVNMIVDDCAEIKNVVGAQVPNLTPFVKGVRQVQLDRLLNKEPNPFQDINSFRRAILLDFVIDGNMFIHWDGVYMYHLPAVKMKVLPDRKTFIRGYEYSGEGGVIPFKTEEIIHVKDNSYQSIYRGSSRLKPALRTMAALLEMRNFQDNFFKNGAVPGLTITSEDRLNDRLKEKLLHEWSNRYRPGTGGRRPIILDGGLKIDKISDVNFQELDFQNAIAENEKIILKALGIPPILMDGGNNANIRPNHRIYYLEAILPIISKMTSAFERFFGFEVYEDTQYIHALRPELRDEAAYYQTLVNGGVISANEAREALGKEPKEGHDDLRIPANIAGSAADPSQGGRPPED